MSVSVEQVFSSSEDYLTEYLKQIDQKVYKNINEKRYMVIYYLILGGKIIKDAFIDNPKFGEALLNTNSYVEFKKYLSNKASILGLIEFSYDDIYESELIKDAGTVIYYNITILESKHPRLSKGTKFDHIQVEFNFTNMRDYLYKIEFENENNENGEPIKISF